LNEHLAGNLISGILRGKAKYFDGRAIFILSRWRFSTDFLHQLARVLQNICFSGGIKETSVPPLFNWAEGGKTPPVALPRLRELGYAIVIFPISTLLAATRAIREVLAQIREVGTPNPVMERLVPFQEFLDFIGLPEVRELERRFAEKDTVTR